MQRYDGEALVGDKRMVQTSYIIQENYTYLPHKPLTYHCSPTQARSGVLRQEYVYSEIFHESNEALLKGFPEELLQFAPDGFKRPQETIEI